MKKLIIIILLLSFNLIGCSFLRNDPYSFEKIEIFNSQSSSIRYETSEEVNLKFTFNIPSDTTNVLKSVELENYGVVIFDSVLIQNNKTIALYKLLLTGEFGEVDIKVLSFNYQDSTLSLVNSNKGISNINNKVLIEVQRQDITALNNNLIYDDINNIIDLSSIEFINPFDLSITKYEIDDQVYDLTTSISFDSEITEELNIEDWVSLKLYYEVYPNEEVYILINLFNEEVVELDSNNKIFDLEMVDNERNNLLLDNLDLTDLEVYKVQNKIFVLNSLAIPKTYSITYNLDEGEFLGSVIDSYNIRDNVLLPTPSKAGYEFIGWTSDDILTPTLDLRLVNEALDKEFNANWAPNEYVIYFNPNGGVIPNQIQTVYYNEAYTLTPAVREGYIFLGWFYQDVRIEDGIWERFSGLNLSARWEALD